MNNDIQKVTPYSLPDTSDNLLKEKPIDFFKKHLPYAIGVILVSVNYLVDSNVLSFSSHTTIMINAILSALGLGILHKRQQ